MLVSSQKVIPFPGWMIRDDPKAITRFLLAVSSPPGLGPRVAALGGLTCVLPDVELYRATERGASGQPEDQDRDGETQVTLEQCAHKSCDMK